MPGVVNTVAGYTNGDTTDPTYDEVCSGTTGHAEAVQVRRSPSVFREAKNARLAIKTVIQHLGRDFVTFVIGKVIVYIGGCMPAIQAGSFHILVAFLH